MKPPVMAGVAPVGISLPLGPVASPPASVISSESLTSAPSTSPISPVGTTSGASVSPIPSSPVPAPFILPIAPVSPPMATAPIPAEVPAPPTVASPSSPTPFPPNSAGAPALSPTLPFLNTATSSLDPGAHISSSLPSQQPSIPINPVPSLPDSVTVPSSIISPMPMSILGCPAGSPTDSASHPVTPISSAEIPASFLKVSGADALPPAKLAPAVLPVKSTSGPESVIMVPAKPASTLLLPEGPAGKPVSDTPPPVKLASGPAAPEVRPVSGPLSVSSQPQTPILAAVPDSTTSLDKTMLTSKQMAAAKSPVKPPFPSGHPDAIAKAGPTMKSASESVGPSGIPVDPSRPVSLSSQPEGPASAPTSGSTSPGTEVSKSKELSTILPSVKSASSSEISSGSMSSSGSVLTPSLPPSPPVKFSSSVPIPEPILPSAPGLPKGQPLKTVSSPVAPTGPPVESASLSASVSSPVTPPIGPSPPASKMVPSVFEPAPASSVSASVTQPAAVSGPGATAEPGLVSPASATKPFSTSELASGSLSMAEYVSSPVTPTAHTPASISESTALPVASEGVSPSSLIPASHPAAASEVLPSEPQASSVVVAETASAPGTPAAPAPLTSPVGPTMPVSHPAPSTVPFEAPAPVTVPGTLAAFLEPLSSPGLAASVIPPPGIAPLSSAVASPVSPAAAFSIPATLSPVSSSKLPPGLVTSTVSALDTNQVPVSSGEEMPSQKMAPLPLAPADPSVSTSPIASILTQLASPAPPPSAPVKKLELSSVLPKPPPVAPAPGLAPEMTPSPISATLEDDELPPLIPPEVHVEESPLQPVLVDFSPKTAVPLAEVPTTAPLPPPPVKQPFLKNDKGICLFGLLCAWILKVAHRILT